MERKSINDAVAYIRGLAELRGRNADWAEQAVRAAESLSATQALEQNVIDIIAESVPDLLAAIDGRTVKVGDAEWILADRGPERRTLRGRLAHAPTGDDHRPEYRLPADAHRHLWPAVRGL